MSLLSIKRIRKIASVLLFSAIVTISSSAGFELYPVHPDALAKEGVPRGTVIEGIFTASKIYPGTSHGYAVYVPEQYCECGAANLIVFQDGGGFRNADRGVDATIVLDNLIAKGDIPPTIALFLSPDSGIGPGQPMYTEAGNRSIEYDSVDDLFAKFLIEELMPAALEDYEITDNPADNWIVGNSSSGNSAFAVAWHRNDLFGGVITVADSFTNIRDENIWPLAIRSQEPRNIKTFMVVGELDSNITTYDDWFLANIEMARAFEDRGYDYALAMHKSGHSDAVMRTFLPDILRWMWNNVEFTAEHTVVTSSVSDLLSNLNLK